MGKRERDMRQDKTRGVARRVRDEGHDNSTRSRSDGKREQEPEPKPEPESEPESESEPEPKRERERERSHDPPVPASASYCLSASLARISSSSEWRLVSDCRMNSKAWEPPANSRGPEAAEWGPSFFTCWGLRGEGLGEERERGVRDRRVHVKTKE